MSNDGWVKFDYAKATAPGDGYDDELYWICYEWELDGKPHRSVELGYFEFYKNQPSIENFDVLLLSDDDVSDDCIIKAIKPILTPDLPEWLGAKS